MNKSNTILQITGEVLDRYHAWHCESLSKVYGEEGRPGLDREILRMLCEYAVLKGHHPSLERYRHALEAPEKEKIFQETAQALQAAYDLLQSEDQAHPLTAQSEAARAYRLTARKLQDRQYTALARLCSECSG